MAQRRFWFFLAVSCFICIFGCDKGLTPDSGGSGSGAPGGVSGTIRYRNWPVLDSLRDLRLVAFTIFPPTNIVADVLNGRAIVYPPLGDTSLVPFYVDSIHYKIALPAGTYPYLVVAQQFGPDIFTAWRPVGQYDLDSNLALPSPITVHPGDTARNIDINVDFINRPPPPF